MDEDDLRPPIEALLVCWRRICEQINVPDKHLHAAARRSPSVRCLKTVPGVGPIVATAYATTIDDPNRFRKSSSVGAYIGLIPRRHQTGELDDTGRISKRGDKLLRRYLFEAAGILLNRMRRPSWLRTWGQKLMKRLGFKKAAVAVALKIVVIMHRIWMDGSSFTWSRKDIMA